MSQCFSWHNLRYIKNQQNLEVFNANIIVFLQGIMYVHKRVHARICALHAAHTHTHTPKNIFSAGSQALRTSVIVNWIHFDWNVLTLCIRKKVQCLDHADSWLTWAWPRCGIWSILAQTHISSFEFMSTWLERQLVQVLYFWSRYAVNHRNVFRF